MFIIQVSTINIDMNPFREALKKFQYQKPMPVKTGLVYGNPTRYQVEVTTNPNDLYKSIIQSGVAIKYYNMPYNAFLESSGDPVSRKELQYMIDLQSGLTEDDKSFILECERHVEEVWVKELDRIGIPKIDKDKIKDFLCVTDGLLMSLKYHYQRPRPLQLAYTYSVPLYPFLATSANSPAYPSGHSFDAYKIAFLLAKRYPEKAMHLLEVAERITMSRVKGGVHYPSDSALSKLMARELTDQGFFDKYLV